jgi:hypothetical protein
MEAFPVLIGTNVETFHDIDGGYHRSGGYHIVNLIHFVNNVSSPPSHINAKNIELHLDQLCLTLATDSRVELGDYPDEDYVLSLQVTDYQSSKYTFADELQQNIDKRETEFSWEE